MHCCIYQSSLLLVIVRIKSYDIASSANHSIMDAVLSLPLVSYLLIPGVTTYSTSLNLLFFYITWSTLVLSHAPLKVEMIGSVAVRVLFFIVPSLVFLLFDSALPTVAVSIKTQGATALPTRTISSGSRRKSSRQQNVWWLITCVGLGNLLLGVALQAGVELLFTHVLHIRSALKVTTTLPSPWHMIKDLLRGFLVREVSRARRVFRAPAGLAL